VESSDRVAAPIKRSERSEEVMVVLQCQ